MSTVPSKREFLDRVVKELNLDTSDPFTLLLANALALADQCDALKAPIPMVLHCPKCHGQHIDEPNPAKNLTNPPHRSHECQFCGTIWRPADVPTTGVNYITTVGKADTPPAERSKDATLPYWDFVSDEPLGIIEANECSHHETSLSVQRFRRAFNEIHKLRRELGDRERASPDWYCLGCGSINQYTVIQVGNPMDSVDQDLQCTQCGSTAFEEGAHSAFMRLRGVLDRLQDRLPDLYSGFNAMMEQRFFHSKGMAEKLGYGNDMREYILKEKLP